MNKGQSIPYNQIDFIIKAPRFRIVFSYMDDKNVTFVREYLLRLLKLIPCKPEQIACYFGFSQHETEIALGDLESNKWIVWQDNGMVTLSREGLSLFSNGNDSPQIPNLREYGGEYCMELLDNNFLLKKNYDSTRQQAIELSVEPKLLSESKETARKIFQNRFRQLQEDQIIELDEKDIALYKIDAIESKGAPAYFRFTQRFELLFENGDTKERHDVPNIIHQDVIQQAITKQIEKTNGANNLRELKQSMSELNDNDTLKVLFGGQLDSVAYMIVWQKYAQQNGDYFLGQIYHQEDIFKNINGMLDKLNKQSNKPSAKLYWIAPSNTYWGKQRKIHDKIQNLLNKQSKSYKFHLYLPLSSESNKREKQEWLWQFKDIDKKALYGFCEGFLNGNTEILFLENTFAMVCYHAELPAYPVPLPIGFFTTKLDEVKKIGCLIEQYLNETMYSDHSEHEIRMKDFGLLNNINPSYR
jgi:hypothetical protein